MIPASSTTAPVARAHSPRREARIAWWIIAAATVINATLLMALAYAGYSMNRSARAAEKATISREIDRAVLTRLGELKGVALWDEAVVRTQLRDRPWMDQEITDYLIPSFGHDAIYLLDSRDRLFYRAATKPRPDDRAVMRAIAPLLQRARSHPHPRD